MESETKRQMEELEKEVNRNRKATLDCPHYYEGEGGYYEETFPQPGGWNLTLRGCRKCMTRARELYHSQNN